MEQGQRRMIKEIVQKFARLYKYNSQELLVLFLNDKVLYEIGDEDLAKKALHVAEEQIKYQKKMKND